MRIIFISQHFHPEQFSNNTISRALHEKGHDVDVITCVPNYPEGVFYDGYSNSLRRTETWNGIRIYRARTVPRGRRAVQLVVNYLGYVLFGTWTARKVARAQRPDVSFVSMTSPVLQGLVGIYLKYLYGVPLVYWVQDIWPESATYTLGLKNPFLVKPLYAFCGWIYRRADHVLVQSAAFPPMIERFGVARDRIGVFPNSASPIYRPVHPQDAPDEALLLPKSGFRIMFAGNIGESQDFDTIIETAKALRPRVEVQWLIIGAGRDEERVKARVATEGLDDVFHFLGRYPEERMPLFFAHADAMLVSLKRNDIFALTVPFKVQSYLACGKPIIGSLDGEGARIIIESGAGVVAPAGAPARLAEQIESLIDSFDKTRSDLERNSRAYFEKHYSQEVVMRVLTETLAAKAK